MSAFQAFYERVHLGFELPPLPHLRPPATLPPAWIDDDAWFRLYPEVAPPAPLPPQRLVPAKVATDQAVSLRSLKRDILAQLADYQVYAERLRRWDPESYKLFRRIGMYMPPEGMQADGYTLEPAVLRSLPGFGAVALGLNWEPEDKDRLPSRMVYFRKLDRPGCDVEQRGGGVIYRCHTYWDDAKDAKLNKLRGYGVGMDYAVHVAPDGTMAALRMRQSAPQTIHHKRGTWRGYQSKVVHQRWALPDVHCAADKKADWIIRVFCLTMNFWLQSAQQSMIRVTASKGGLVMPFVVDILQTPQFFADREPVMIDGKKRRIFHIVRAHIRHTKHGDLPIRTHFAGLRQFTWAGYDIAISVPGRDHRDIAEMDVGCVENGTDEELASGAFMEQAEFADIVADTIGAPKVMA